MRSGPTTSSISTMFVVILTLIQLSRSCLVHAYRITPLANFGCRRIPQYGGEYTQQRRFSVNNDNSEFDFLLGEYSYENQNYESKINNFQTQKQQRHHHRRVVLPSSPSDCNGRHIVLASSTFAGSVAAPSMNMYDDEDVATEANTDGVASESVVTQGEGETTYDPYANALDSQFNKIEQYKEKQATSALENRLKSMDLQDIVLTLFIPGVLTFVAGRYIFQKVSTKVSANTDSILDSFANEMIYHDGDYKEMELCYKDYSKKLVYMGPLKSDAMIKRYLELYSKKKTVSPQAIVSLSYVFTIFQLSEEKAASILVQLCNDMGTSKISSIGKLLFLGTRILKSDVAIQKLQLIKTLIMSTYRDERVAESLVETSQQAIAEAAYRTAVLAAGKNQENLAPGWEVLGLSYDAATRVWETEKKENFTSDRETMYGGQTRKYDKSGRQVKDDGKLVNPEEATPDDSSSGSSATSNVYECGNCGFTLFVAAGRETKFFGDNFTCPECGAAKTEFKARDTDE